MKGYKLQVNSLILLIPAITNAFSHNSGEEQKCCSKAFTEFWRSKNSKGNNYHMNQKPTKRNHNRFNNQGSWEQKSLKKETILGSKTPLYQVIQVSKK
jgi:hypothetical protein